MASVIIGDDGYLFLDNDTNRVIDQTLGRFPFSDVDVEAISATHRERSDLLGGKGRYLHAIVPNKETVLNHLMPANYRYQSSGLTPVNFYLERARGIEDFSFFRPNSLRDLHSSREAYARQDTHWTYAGALHYFAKALVFGGLGAAGTSIAQMNTESRKVEQVGDLGSKIGLEAEIVDYVRPASQSRRLLFTNAITNEGCVRLYSNKSASVRSRVLVLHDSTALWLLDFIAETFAEALLIHYPDFDSSFVESFGPDKIIFLQVERFFIRAPKNNISWADAVGAEEARKGTSCSAVSYLSDPTRLLAVLE